MRDHEVSPVDTAEVIAALNITCKCGYIGCSGGGQGHSSFEAGLGASWLLENDCDSQVILAQEYERGENVRQSNTRALRWYFHAANRGSAKARMELGRKYEFGDGVDMDYQEAMRWYKAATDLDSSEAFYALAELNESGKGVKANDFEAVRWYLKAADAGYAAAQIKLGHLTCSGRGGLTKNTAEGFRWFEKAAFEQQHPLAQHIAGTMLLDGEGTTQDIQKAARLFRR